jgi:hypothetical protein
MFLIFPNGSAQLPQRRLHSSRSPPGTGSRRRQFQATNLIVERVLLGRIKQGLIWHFQGSGKSLLMVSSASG